MSLPVLSVLYTQMLYYRLSHKHSLEYPYTAVPPKRVSDPSPLRLKILYVSILRLHIQYNVGNIEMVFMHMVLSQHTAELQVVSSRNPKNKLDKKAYLRKHECFLFQCMFLYLLMQISFAVIVLHS